MEPPKNGQKWPKNGHLGLKINILGPGGADFGRLGLLRLFAGLKGSTEYLYAILGWGSHWNPLQMAKKGQKMAIWA